MKKTVNVNIGGAPFTVDEDAYGMLKKYLDEIASMRATCSSPMW